MSNNENIPSNYSQDSNSEAVPFFVRYLEGQLEELSEKEAESTSGGGCSDNIETRKYPSDDNEDTFTSVTKLKYLFDHIFGPKEDPSNAPPYAVTLKYPSDDEDC